MNVTDDCEQFMRLGEKNNYTVRPANQIKITHNNKLHKSFPHITVTKSLVTSEDKYLSFVMSLLNTHSSTYFKLFENE